MGCKHNFVYTQGYFVCTKCKMRTYGSLVEKRKTKKAIVVVVTLIVIGIILVASGVFEANELEDVTSDATALVDKLPQTVREPLEELDATAIDGINQTSSDIIAFAKDIGKLDTTTKEESMQAIEYVNQLRQQNDKQVIKWDERVFSLSAYWSKELYDTGSFDHTNPITGNCPYTIKEGYGLASNEDVADNLHSTGYGPDGSNPTLSNPNFKGVIDGWMTSPGHRYNLLFHDHVSGAYACHGGICSFLGMNHVGYGSGCSTAAEGEAQFGKLESCTPEQLSQYENMVKRYDDDLQQYNSRVPKVAISESEYRYFMDWYEKLEQQEKSIESFGC